MPTLDRVLFDEAKWHGCDYASCQWKPIAKQVVPPVQVIETNGTAFANDTAMKQQPAEFYGVGHGSNNVFTCDRGDTECKEVYIKVGGPRIDWFGGMYVHLLSCSTAIELGPELIRQGARAYIGYDYSYFYGVGRSHPPCEGPNPNGDYYSMDNSDLEGEVAILFRRASVGHALQAIKDKFNYYIELYTTGDRKDWPIAEKAVLVLQSNLDCLCALGDLNFIPCPSATPPPSGDFKISLSPSSIGIAQGSSGVISVKVEKTDDYKERVALSSRNLPSGVTISFNPSSGVPNFISQATIKVGSNVSPGNYSVLIVGTGPDGVTRGLPWSRLTILGAGM